MSYSRSEDTKEKMKSDDEKFAINTFTPVNDIPRLRFKIFEKKKSAQENYDATECMDEDDREQIATSPSSSESETKRRKVDSDEGLQNAPHEKDDATKDPSKKKKGGIGKQKIDTTVRIQNSAQRKVSVSKRKSTLLESQRSLFKMGGLQSWAVLLPESGRIQICGTGLFDGFEKIPLSRFTEGKGTEEIRELKIEDLIKAHINQKICQEIRNEQIDPTKKSTMKHKKPPVHNLCTQNRRRYQNMNEIVEANQI